MTVHSGDQDVPHRRMPDFFVIGAMRSGTTALYSFLQEHPGVFVSDLKEPNYYAFAEGEHPDRVEGSRCVTTLGVYRDCFAAAQEGQVAGEASHSYLYYPGALERIRESLGDVKLVCILREPASRAFSHFMFHLSRGLEETSDFARALALEEERVAKGRHFGHYVRRGLYAAQMRHVMSVFPPHLVRVYLYDDLASHPIPLVQDLYRFLGVDDTFEPDTTVRRNPSGIPRSEILHRVLVRRNPLKRSLQPVLPRKLYRIAARVRDWNLVKPDLDPAIRARLAERFHDDIVETQALIDRDLSSWLA